MSMHYNKQIVDRYAWLDVTFQSASASKSRQHRSLLDEGQRRWLPGAIGASGKFAGFALENRSFE